MNIASMDLIQDMIRLFRKQNFNRGDRLFPSWIQNFSVLIGICFEEKAYLNQFEEVINEKEISAALKEIMSAQEQKDYVLLADFLEMKVIPLLVSIQEILRMHAQEQFSFYTNCFDLNLAYLQETQPKLAALLQKQYAKMCSSMDRGILLSYTDKLHGCIYEIEQTTQGAPTLKLTDKNGSWYMHGNNSPMEEARFFAGQYYEQRREDYVIYGMGLGYHVLALFEECRGTVPITVFESDLNILIFAFQLHNLIPYMKNGVQIIFDSDFRLFAKALENPSEAPVIHYPSLRNIFNPNVKKKLEELFVHDSSVRNQLGEMLANFRHNIKNCGHYADELRPSIMGKDVYLVAAGPSLDKNIELLREKPANAAVIVVGTAFRKLVTLGIRPDFVIFLDASSRIYSQLSGLEQETIPMLVASTALRSLAQNYAGETYLICQEGFAEAEQYALQRGYHTYMTGGSVATIAFDAALSLGAKRVIAIGLDLAYTGNKIHAMNAGRRELSDDMAGFMEIKASDGGTVYTNPAMEMYREWFERRIAKARKEQGEQLPEFINATEGGAYIEGMEYCTLAEAIQKGK